jgi:adhesin transport system membrane fusion protein
MSKQGHRDYFIIILIVSLIIFAGLWAKNTYLDVVTLAQGRVVATGENKIVQAPQSAKITDFHVLENEYVQEGDILITLSPIQASASLEELNIKILNLLARKLSLSGDLNNLSIVEIEMNLKGYPEQIRVAEIENVSAKRESLKTKLDTLDQQIVVLGKELNSLEVTKRGKVDLLSIINEEKKEIENLLALGAVGNAEKYKIDREQRTIEVEIAATEENMLLKRAEMDGVEKEKLAIKSGYAASLIEEISDIEPQILELEAKKPAFEERLRETEVTSPINGKINKLFFNTEGAVIREGEQLVEIVPTDNELEIIAYIDPKDIGLVEPGQKTRITLTAFDPSKFGYLEGRLSKISVDAIFRDQTRSYMYEIATSMKTDNFVDENNLQIQVTPGMIAQVAIIRGERSILNYFWQPIMKTKDMALRE